jgi:hypothetical protein
MRASHLLIRVKCPRLLYQSWLIDVAAIGPAKNRPYAMNAAALSRLTFMYFRSSARRRFPLQFDLIVINGVTDEIF